MSLQTFYAHFAGKEDAFVATYETGHARAMAVINQTLARQTSWIGAVRAGVAALLELLACEPSYAHLACVDVMVAYPHMAQRAQQANDFYAGLLDLRRAPDAPSLLPSPVVGEAIVGGVFELLHDYVLRGQSHGGCPSWPTTSSTSRSPRSWARRPPGGRSPRVRPQPGSSDGDASEARLLYVPRLPPAHHRCWCHPVL